MKSNRSCNSRFDLSAVSNVYRNPFALEKVKHEVRSQFLEPLQDHEHLLELALNEAEALAWQTEYPYLVFPTLAAEKVQAVAQWNARQESLLARGFPMTLAA